MFEAIDEAALDSSLIPLMGYAPGGSRVSPICTKADHAFATASSQVSLVVQSTVPLCAGQGCTRIEISQLLLQPDFLFTYVFHHSEHRVPKNLL
jgi:hypothetical protein